MLIDISSMLLGLNLSYHFHLGPGGYFNAVLSIPINQFVNIPFTKRQCSQDSEAKMSIFPAVPYVFLL